MVINLFIVIIIITTMKQYLSSSVRIVNHYCQSSLLPFLLLLFWYCIINITTVIVAMAIDYLLFLEQTATFIQSRCYNKNLSSSSRISLSLMSSPGFCGEHINFWDYMTNFTFLKAQLFSLSCLCLCYLTIPYNIIPYYAILYLTVTYLTIQ